jgi:S1-C subfamily serine protease
MDVHKEAIVIAVQNESGKLVMESVIETKDRPVPGFSANVHPMGEPDRLSKTRFRLALGSSRSTSAIPSTKASRLMLILDAKRAPLGQGSGFIVAKNRVVTNYHVVAGSASAPIVFDDGLITVVTAVVAGSEPKDLVIVEAETGNRPTLGLGDELQLKVGETI